MSGQDLFCELKERVAGLDTALNSIEERGRDYAKSEYAYRVALAKQILIERDKRIPVTIIYDICRGDPVIADLKFKRDVAEAVYKAAIEACNVQKLQIKVLENQINREWKG